MRLRASWIVAVCILAISSGTAWAQSEEPEFVPSEGSPDCYVTEPTGPIDDLAAGLLICLALIPLGAAWSSAQGRQFAAARRWIASSLVVAGAQGAYGLSRIYFPRTYETLTYHPDLAHLSRHFLDPDEGLIFLTTSAAGLLAAWGMWAFVKHRSSVPDRLTAGTRIRTPEAVDAGPVP